MRKITCLYNRVFPVSAETYLSTWSRSYTIPKQLTPSPVNPWRQVQLNEPTVLLQCAMRWQLCFCSWHSSKSAKIILDDVSSCVLLPYLSYPTLVFFFSVSLPSRTSYHMSVLESMEIVILRTFQCAYACVFPYTTSKLLDKCPIGIKFLFFRENFSIKAEKRTRCDRKDHEPSG